MAWTKTSWADVIGTDATKSSVGAGSTATGNIDCNDANPYIVAAIKVRVIFGSSPDDGVDISFFGRDADGAAENDTVPIFAASIEESSTAELGATYQVNVAGLDTLNVKITNNDSADSVDVWVSRLGAYQ
jgi:hypothetical protein